MCLVLVKILKFLKFNVGLHVNNYDKKDSYLNIILPFQIFLMVFLKHFRQIIKNIILHYFSYI